MMGAFNHRWRAIPDAPAPVKEQLSVGTYWKHVCGRPKCHEQIVAQVAYDYITGRSGRVSDAQKYVCAAHLAKFLANTPHARKRQAVAYEHSRRVFLFGSALEVPDDPQR